MTSQYLKGMLLYQEYVGLFPVKNFVAPFDGCIDSAIDQFLHDEEGWPLEKEPDFIDCVTEYCQGTLYRED